MAASRLPAIGTGLGPCEGSCSHRDCDETRRQAEALCGYCGEPIGYETRFYMTTSSHGNYTAGSGVVFRIEHASCAEEEAE